MANPLSLSSLGFPSLSLQTDSPELQGPSEEEQSTWLGKTLGGAQWLGEVFGKGAAAERGVLSGLTGGTGEQAGWAGLKNLIPFSDTIHDMMPGSTLDQLIGTDSKKRINGSDLLEQWGMPKTGHESFDWTAPYDWAHAAAGLGVDIATDPLVQFGAGIGGLTAKGAEAAATAKAATSEAMTMAHLTSPLAEGLTEAEKVAALAEKFAPLAETTVKTPLTVAEQLRQGERALVSGKVPFGDYLPGTNLGLSNESAADLWKAANYSKYSPLSYIRGTLSEKATGSFVPGKGEVTYDPVIQRANDAHYLLRSQQANQGLNLGVVLAREEGQLKTMWSGMMATAKEQGNADLETFARTMAETKGGLPEAAVIKKQLDDLMVYAARTPDESVNQTAAVASKLHDYLDLTMKADDAARDSLKALGYDVRELDDFYAGHMPRHSSALRELVGASSYRSGTSAEHKYVGRVEALKNWPGGTELPQAVFTDPLVTGHRLIEDAEGVMKSASIPAKERVEDLQAYFASLASDAKNTSPADSIRFQSLATEKDIDALREAYVQEKHVSPALNKEWAKREAESGVGGIAREPLPSEEVASGVPKELTRADEETRLLAPGAKPVKDLLNEVDAVYGTVAKARGGDVSGLLNNGLFDQSILTDSAQYRKAAYLRVSTMLGAHQLISTPDVVKSVGDAAAESWEPLADAWKRAKMMEPGLQAWVKKNKPNEWAAAMQKYVASPESVAKETLERAGVTNSEAQASLIPQLVAKVAPPAADAEAKAFADVIGDLRINPSAAKALQAFTYVANPKNENVILKGFDRISNFIKSNLYNIWPGSHIRDVGSHFFIQLEEGTANPVNLLKNTLHSYKYIANWKDLDAAKIGFLNELPTVSEGRLGGQLQDIMGSAGKSYESMPKGGFDWLLRGSAKEAIDRKGLSGKLSALNPFAAPGAMGSKTGEFNLPQIVGARAQQLQMYTQQSGLYVTLREQGLSPAAAWQKVKSASMDYEAMSQFDKDVMKRAIPFWGFMRKNVPYQISHLAENAGGLGSQTMQFMSRASSQANPDVYTPQFLQENQAYAIGKDDPTKQGFYRNSILPFNDFNDIVFKGGLPQVGRSLEKFASRANPLLLMGPELAAGKQFATGRKIKDLESTTKIASRGIGHALGASEDYQGTAMPELDRIIHYSPFSRAAGELESALDTRKSWPMLASGLLGTGRTSSYDTSAWKLRDMRNAMGENLEVQPEMKQWTDYFLPAAEKEKMEPERRADMESIMKRRGQLTRILAQQRKANPQP